MRRNASWSLPRNIGLQHPEAKSRLSVGNGNHGIQLKDGRLVIQGGWMAEAKWISAGKYMRGSFIVSDDHGETWRIAGWYKGTAEDAKLNRAEQRLRAPKAEPQLQDPLGREGCGHICGLCLQVRCLFGEVHGRCSSCGVNARSSPPRGTVFRKVLPFASEDGQFEPRADFLTARA